MYYLKKITLLFFLLHGSQSIACLIPVSFPVEQLQYAESVFVGVLENYEEVNGAYASYNIQVEKVLRGENYGERVVVFLVNRFLSQIHGYELNNKYIFGTTVLPEELESLPFRHKSIVSESVLGANTKEYLDWVKEQKWVMREICSDPMLVLYSKEKELQILEYFETIKRGGSND